MREKIHQCPEKVRHVLHKIASSGDLKLPNSATMVGTEDDLFIVLDGLRIAKRGHRGTPHANTWVALEPGYEIYDVPGGIAVEKKFVDQH